jgi:hypothetical protein
MASQKEVQDKSNLLGKRRRVVEEEEKEENVPKGGGGGGGGGGEAKAISSAAKYKKKNPDAKEDVRKSAETVNVDAKRYAEMLLAKQDAQNLLDSGQITEAQAKRMMSNLNPGPITAKNREMIQNELDKLQDGLRGGEMVTVTFPSVEGAGGEDLKEEEDVEVILLPEAPQDKGRTTEVRFAKGWIMAIRRIELVKNGVKTGASYFGLIVYNEAAYKKNQKEVSFKGGLSWITTLHKSLRKIDFANPPPTPITLDAVKKMSPNEEGIIEVWKKGQHDYKKKTYKHVDPNTKDDIFSVGLAVKILFFLKKIQCFPFFFKFTGTCD